MILEVAKGPISLLMQRIFWHARRCPGRASKNIGRPLQKEPSFRASKKHQSVFLPAFRHLSSVRVLFLSRFAQTAQQRGLLDFDALKPGRKKCLRALISQRFSGIPEPLQNRVQGFKSFCLCQRIPVNAYFKPFAGISFFWNHGFSNGFFAASNTFLCKPFIHTRRRNRELPCNPPSALFPRFFQSCNSDFSGAIRGGIRAHKAV